MIFIIAYFFTKYYKLLKEKNQNLTIIDNYRLKHESLQTKLNQLHQELEAKFQTQFDSWKVLEEKKIRKDSLDRSRSVLRGQATEHLAPIMMEGMNLKDFRFMGNPIDYVVFDGCSAISDKKSDTIESIVFVDIKTGSSNLTKVQRRIRDCIKNGNIKFMVYNPDKKDSKTIIGD